MKIAIIADPHIGARGDSETFLKCQQKFFDNIFFPTLKERGITTVIDLGDTFDRRKFINFRTLELAQQFFFNPLRDNGIDTHIIVGNHTTFYKNTNRLNSVDILLREYKNITVYASPQTIALGGIPIAIVPWITDENSQEVSDFVDADDSEVCMGHFEFTGFETLKGVVHEEGIETKQFKKYKKVLSGHFHYKQDNGHVFYLGCPYEMLWTSVPEEKGFHIFDTETLELEFIPNPYTLFKRIRYNDGCDDDITQIAGCYVRVYVNKKTDNYAFDVFMDQVFAAQPVHVTIIDDIAINRPDDGSVVFEGTADTLKLLNMYIDNLDGIDNKDDLKKIASTIYTEAITSQDK